MTNKPDYYAVLGVEKTATDEELKKAHKRIIMRNHPDAVRGKPEADRKQAEETYKLANEAYDVLSNRAKRTTYDNYGHQGLENMAAGVSTGTGQTWEQAAGPVAPMRKYSEEDTFGFFDQVRTRRDRDGENTGANGTPAAPRVSAEERRAARLAARQGGSTPAPAASQPSSPATVFKQAVDNLGDVADKLREAGSGDAVIPLNVLEAFRDNLRDFAKEIDNAIDRARAQNGRRPTGP